MNGSGDGYLQGRLAHLRATSLAMSLVLGGFAAILCAGAAHGREVPPDVQRQVEDSFDSGFVYPDTSEWHFDSLEPYPGSYGMVCGTVNYQNAMHHYTGARHFYAIMDQDSVRTTGIDLGEEEDRTGEAAFKMKTFCHLP